MRRIILKNNKYTMAYSRLQNDLEGISAKYNKSKLYFLLDAAYCYIRHGSSPRDYINFDFYKINNIERSTFLTMKKTHKVEKLYNDDKFGNYFNNKFEFNKSFQKYIRRDWVYMPNTSFDDFKIFTEGKKKVIVKPLGSSSGKGIYAIDITGKNIKEIYQELMDKDYLIEELIVQHSDFMRLNESTVNTVRIYTLIDKEGKSRIIQSILRVGGTQTIVDNFHNGGVAYPLDNENGLVYKPGVDIKGNCHKIHPSSGIYMVGFKVPNWEGLKKFVLDATEKFKTSRYIAWDVAVLQDGFEFVEGNYKGDPGMLQAVDKVGKAHLFKELK